MKKLTGFCRSRGLLESRKILRGWTTAMAAVAVIVGGMGVAAPAQAVVGTTVSFTVLQEGIPETARVRSTNTNGNTQWQPYGTTRTNVQKTCPANSHYKLRVPAPGGYRYLKPGECRTWAASGAKVVGVFRESYTEPVDPPVSGWPDATTTGYQGNVSALPKRNGWRVTTPGAVIENMRIDAGDGALVIDAPNVTVRNVVIDAGIWGIDALHTADGLTVEDSTFIGGLQAGIGLDPTGGNLTGWTLQRLNMSGGNDAIKPNGQGVIRDNYLHDLGQIGNDPHNDIMQFGDVDGVLVQHNMMKCRDTSCIAMFENQATFRNVTIENNHMGGAGYTIYAGGNDGTNIVIRNNTFGPYGYQHPVTDWDPKPGHVFTGNKFTDGTPVPTP